MNEPDRIGELAENIHRIIQSTVQEAGGNWKRSFHKEVVLILALIDKEIEK